jgi:ATP-dependent Clp protease ATP-binding subunit ClpA
MAYPFEKMFFFTHTLRDLENPSPRAQQALALAQEEAAALNHDAVTPDHLILGLLKLGQGVACDVLRCLGVDLEVMRAEAAIRAGPVGDPRPPGPLPYTRALRKVLAQAPKEARRLDHHYIGTEHLLVALLREGSLPARPGLNVQRIISGIEEVLAPARTTKDASGQPGSGS